MPGFVKTKEDERLWAKAKGIAEDSGHKENWAYITGIYKKMKGGKVGADYEFKSGPESKKAFDGFDFFDESEITPEAPQTPEDLATQDFEKQTQGLPTIMAFDRKVCRDTKVIQKVGGKCLYIRPYKAWFLFAGIPASGAARFGVRVFKSLVGLRNLSASTVGLHNTPLWVGTSEGKAIKVNPPQKKRAATPTAPYHGGRAEKMLGKTDTHVLWQTGGVPGQMTKMWVITDYAGKFVEVAGRPSGYQRKGQAMKEWQAFKSQKTADKIPGGKADKKKPSDFDAKELAMGVEIEMEHTTDKALAKEIAMDHLTEFGDYYTALKKMEDALENKSKTAGRVALRYLQANGVRK